jgi:hypothetical protein
VILRSDAGFPAISDSRIDRIFDPFPEASGSGGPMAASMARPVTKRE